MIWTIVTFVVVLVILRLTAWKPIMKSLQGTAEQASKARSQKPSRIKNEAERFARSTRRCWIARRTTPARFWTRHAATESTLQEELRNRAQQEAEEFKTRAHREIELQKDSAIKEIWDQTAELSTALASRVLGRTLQGADQERLVRELLAGMQERNERDERVRSRIGASRVTKHPVARVYTRSPPGDRQGARRRRGDGRELARFAQTWGSAAGRIARLLRSPILATREEARDPCAEPCKATPAIS